jgi:hypothetical protein
MTTTEPAVEARGSASASSPVYVCRNTLCGRVSSSPGSCCGQPMAAQ